MAINVSNVEAAVKAALKTAWATEFGEAESFYDGMAGTIASAVVPAILNEIKDNADLTGVTSGVDTVSGGVD